VTPGGEAAKRCIGRGDLPQVVSSVVVCSFVLGDPQTTKAPVRIVVLTRAFFGGGDRCGPAGVARQCGPAGIEPATCGLGNVASAEAAQAGVLAAAGLSCTACNGSADYSHGYSHRRVPSHDSPREQAASTGVRNPSLTNCHVHDN
jgi:hypothetical protein